MKTSSPRHHAPGFSLIEILVVISIIVLLVGIVAGAYSVLRAQAEIERTRLALQNLKAAEVEYRAQTGKIETFTGTATSKEESIDRFVDRVRDIRDVENMILALDTLALVEETGTDRGRPFRVVDAWDEPIQYRSSMNEGPAYSGAGNLPGHGRPATTGVGARLEDPRPFFASSGPDGDFGTEDDIFSFEIDN